MLSREWIEQLEQLHNRVPAVPYATLQAQLTEDLGGNPKDVFAWFDEAHFHDHLRTVRQPRAMHLRD